MNRKGFTLIEVLIATLILSISVLSATAAIKQFFKYRERFSKYENFYISVLSLVDEISTMELENNLEGTGKINGLSYKYKVFMIKKNKNYLFGEGKYDSGNIGNFEIYLYKVKIFIEHKTLSFYITKFKKISVSPLR